MANPTQAALDAGIGIEFDADIRERVAVGSDAGLDFTIHQALEAVESEWRAFEAQADLTAFQTFDWLMTWQRHIGARNAVTPAIVVVRQRGDLVGIWPLGVSRGSRLEVRWLGANLSNYNAPLLATNFGERIDTAAFLALWQAIKRKLRDEFGADLIDFDKMPERIGAQLNPMLQLPVTRYHCDAYQSRLGSDWETFYGEKRSPKTRRTDRKKRKRLAEAGPVSFVTATEPGDIVRSLEVMIEQKSQSYAEMGVDNVFDPPGHREFFIDFASTGRGLAHVSRLDVGSTIAAANFGLMHRGSYTYVVASYDHGDLARFGPGTAHLHDLMQYSIEQGFKEFDFTIGDEPYKREWCDSELKLFDLVVPMTSRGYLVAAPTLAVRLLKNFIARNPRIWSIVRKARSTVAAWRKPKAA
jgi:CelD/BcsL family acetyltransferase involved in cellulose biosynthesis